MHQIAPPPVEQLPAWVPAPVAHVATAACFPHARLFAGQNEKTLQVGSLREGERGATAET